MAGHGQGEGGTGALSGGARMAWACRGVSGRLGREPVGRGLAGVVVVQAPMQAARQQVGRQSTDDYGQEEGAWCKGWTW